MSHHSLPTNPLMSHYLPIFFITHSYSAGNTSLTHHSLPLCLQRSKSTLQHSKTILFPFVKVSREWSIPCMIMVQAAVFPCHKGPVSCLLVTTPSPLSDTREENFLFHFTFLLLYQVDFFLFGY